MAEPFDKVSKRLHVQIFGPEENEQEELWIKVGNTKDLKDLNTYKSVWRTEERIAYDEWTNIISKVQEDADAVYSVDGESERGGAKRKNTETNDEPEKRIKLEASSPTFETVQQDERATDPTVTEGIVNPSANIGESEKQIKPKISGSTVEATQHNEQAAIPEDIVDPATNMDDEQLIELFLQVSKPFSPSAYVRLSKLLQHHLKLRSPVPTTLLKHVRDGAPSWTHDYAAYFSKYTMLVGYVKRAPRAALPELLASVFGKDSANPKDKSRTVTSKPGQAGDAYPQYDEKLKGGEVRMALHRTKFLDDEESDSVRMDKARFSLQSFFRNDEVSPKNVPRTASSNSMQPGHAFRELNAELKRKEDLRTRYPDDKESASIRMDGLKTAPQTSAPKLNQGSSPFATIEATSNDLQRAVSEPRQPVPVLQAIETGSETAQRTVSPSRGHGALAFQTVKATSNNVPQATVSTYFQTSPSDGKAYTEIESLSKRGEDLKAKYSEAKESDPVCTDNPQIAPQAVEPELGLNVEIQVASPLRSAQTKSKSVQRTAVPAHGQINLTKRKSHPKYKVSPGTLRAFIAKYPEAKDRRPVRMDNPTTEPRSGCPGPEPSLGQAYQALRGTENASFKETDAIIAKYFTKAEENELVRMDQLKKALRSAVAPAPKHDEAVLMASYPGLDVKLDALLSDAVVAKHFVKAKESVAERMDSPSTAPRANSPGPTETRQPYGTAFRMLMVKHDVWHKESKAFFAEHFPKSDGKE